MSILGLSWGSPQGSSGQQPQPYLSWDCPVDPIRDPPDNSPNRVHPGTVLGIPSGILRTTTPTVSILGLSSGSHQGSFGQQPQPCLSWTVLGIPSGILRTTAPTVSILGLSSGSHQGSSGQQPQPETVLRIPSGILRTTASTMSILGLPWGSHASGILGTPVHMLLKS